MADYFEEDILAYVNFGREGNRRHKILLTKKQLIVIRDRKERTFDISDIKVLKITSRKMLLPLIAGGVIFPFSLISMYTGIFSPYLLLFFILSGLYLLHLGFTGHPVICLEIQPKEFDINISQVSDNIRAFVNFVNTLLPKSNVPEKYRMIYVPVPANIYERRKAGEIIENPGQSVFEAFTHEQWPTAREGYGGPGWVVLLVDPLKVSARVHYRASRKSGKLQPFLEGKINPDAFRVISP